MRRFLFAWITLLAAGCQTQYLGSSSGQPCLEDSDQCSAENAGGSGGAGGSGPSTCGNGELDPGETCDDGNTMDGDACTSLCLPPAVDFAAGGRGTCAILVDGRLKCWGSNLYGALGLGDTMDRGNAPNQMGDFLPAVSLGAGESAASVAGVDDHTCALLNGGKLKCWGKNGYGQLGLGHTNWMGDEGGEMGDNLAPVDVGAGQIPIKISLGAEHTCALLAGGSVKCWGSGSSIGLGDKDARGDEPGEMGDSLPAVDLGTGVTATDISAGSGHTCALLNGGAVKCWGSNKSGQLGLGDIETRGDDPDEMGDNLPAVALGQGATAIAAGVYHTCALLDDGSVKCWGDGGRLGLGDIEPRGDEPGEMGASLPTVDLGSGKTAVSIAVFLSSCVLLNDDSVKCWGTNNEGQLGVGDTEKRGDEPGEMGDNLPAVDLGTGAAPASISVGSWHACARSSDGHLKCWGMGAFGQLGYENTFSKGDAPFQELWPYDPEMGDYLPFVKL